MGYKYNRQIRKVMNGNYRAAFEQVRVYIETKAQSANFFSAVTDCSAVSVQKRF